jgi:23S rRNA-/tRNA-specific pseudouridylate synthase
MEVWNSEHDDLWKIIYKRRNVYSVSSRYSNEKSICFDYPNFQIANRIDKPVSGYIIIYKNVKPFIKDKIYLAFLEKHPPERGDYFIHMHKFANYTKLGNHESYFTGKTHTRVISYGKIGNFWWVLIDLITGFRHQIRCFLASKKTPIIGDCLYKSKCKWKPGIALENISISFGFESFNRIKSFHYASNLTKEMLFLMVNLIRFSRISC